MRKAMLAIGMFFLLANYISGQITPSGWEKIFTGLDGVAQDLEKSAFGYTFVCGSGKVGPDQVSIYSPTTLVAVNNSGNIIWQITNNDLVLNPNHRIVFAGHNDSTNSYIFLVAGYGEYNDTTAMQLWPISADYNPGTQTWSVNSLPVKNYKGGSYTSYFPTDLIYMTDNYYIVSGFVHISQGSYNGAVFSSPFYYDGTSFYPIIVSTCANNPSDQVCVKYGDGYIAAGSYTYENFDDSVNVIYIREYSDIFQTSPSVAAGMTTVLYNNIQSIEMKSDTIILSSVVYTGSYSRPSIIKTNKFAYLFNQYTYTNNNACKKTYTIIDNNNEYLSVGGSLYPGDSLSPPWCGGFYMRNYSNFMFKSYYEHPLNMTGYGVSEYVKVVNSYNNMGQVYLGTYTSSMTNPDNYYPYLTYRANPVMTPHDLFAKTNLESNISGLSSINLDDEVIFSFVLENETNLNISIYDINGRKISEERNLHFNSGPTNYRWGTGITDQNHYSNGIYFIIMENEGNALFKGKFSIFE